MRYFSTLQQLPSFLAATLLVAGQAFAQCPVDDALEDNDSCAAAIPLTVGSYPGLVLFGNDYVPSGRDLDYYKFDVPPGQALTIEIYFSHASGDIDLYLCDDTACVNVLSVSNSTADQETVTVTNNTGAATTYYLEVWDYTGGFFTCNDYDMLVTMGASTCPTAPDDAYEPNDDCASAIALAAGTYTGLHLKAASPDYFQVDVAPNAILTVECLHTVALGDMDIWLYDDLACVNQVAHAGTWSDNEIMSWTNTTGSTVTTVVRIEGWTGFDCNDYDLVLTPNTNPCSSLVDDAYEDNEDCATATPVTGGSLLVGLAAFVADRDMYGITLADSETLTASTYFTHADGDVDLWLYDASDPGCGTGVGELGLSQTVTDDESVTWTNTTGGPVDVVIEVIIYAGSLIPCNTYALEVDVLTVFTPFCFGDGSDGVSCPCGITPALGSGEGCLNGSGSGAYLAGSGDPTVGADTLVLTVHQAAPNDFGIFVQNVTQGGPTPFYNGGFCLASNSHLVRHYAPPGVSPTFTDGSGTGVNAQALTAGDYLNDTQPGVIVWYQFWYRDNTGPCGAGANFTAGLGVLWN